MRTSETTPPQTPTSCSKRILVFNSFSLLQHDLPSLERLWTSSVHSSSRISSAALVAARHAARLLLPFVSLVHPQYESTMIFSTKPRAFLAHLLSRFHASAPLRSRSPFRSLSLALVRSLSRSPSLSRALAHLLALALRQSTFLVTNLELALLVRLVFQPPQSSSPSIWAPSLLPSRTRPPCLFLIRSSSPALSRTQPPLPALLPTAPLAAHFPHTPAAPHPPTHQYPGTRIGHEKKLTALFVGIRWFQNCEEHMRRPEGESSRTQIGFNTFMKDVTRQGSSVA